MRVGLVQINIDMTWSASANGADMDEEESSFGLLPYSVGLLQGYARKHARDEHEFLVPVHTRLSVQESADRMAGAQLVGFSSYIWNEELSLAIARELKARAPETIVVFGGPQVPDRPEAWLQAHPEVDLACHGEGERTFTQVLDAAPERDWATVQGVSFLEGGACTTTPRGVRLKDLSEVPSPFLEGEFDALMAAHPGSHWITMWETNRGCPFSCAFCDWGSATASKVTRFEMDRLGAEIDWMSAHRIGFVFCCDANFGMLPRDLEITQAIIDAKERTGFPFSFSVQNTKNAVERGYKVQKLLNQRLNAYGATISLQSTHAETLQAINRSNISSDAFRELQQRFAADGVYTYTDLIIGLPGDDYESFTASISQVVRDGQHNHIQFHNCSVLPNAELAQPAYVERYGIKTVAQAIRSVHDRVDAVPEVEEHLPLVVATTAMGPHDWVRMKTFAWLTDFAYFDRMLQIPLAVLGHRHDLSLRELVEGLFLEADPADRPLMAAMAARLHEHAGEIQLGGPEYLTDDRLAGLLWPADQFLLLELIADDDLDAFYAEAGDGLRALLAARGVTGEDVLIDEALRINQAAFTLPFVEQDTRVVLSHPVWEQYWALLTGHTHLQLREQLSMYHVDRTTKRWDTMSAYCQHLAWCHNKDKRGYLYPVYRAGAPRRDPRTSSPTLVSS